MNIDTKSSDPTDKEMAAYFDGFPKAEYSDTKGIPRAKLLSDRANSEGDAGQGQVGVDSPSVIAFSDGVSAENREAVMWSLAWAEYAAAKKYSVDDQPIEWLNEYTRAMFFCGWAMTGGHEYGEYKSNSTSLTMDAVLLELIGSIAGPNAETVIKLLSATLDRMQGNKPLMQLFERNSKSGRLAGYRVMPCVESAKGVPISYLVSMHCEYSDESGGALFWKWEVRKLSIRRLAKGVEFFKSRYNKAEPFIQEKLSKGLEEYFDEF